MNVAFFCAEDSGEKFIISDDPCHMFNPELQWQKAYGPGLGQQNTEVKLPLSKDTLLLLSWSNYRGYFAMTAKDVDDQNRMTRAYADKEIATPRDSMKLIWRSPLPLDFWFFARFILMQVKIFLFRVRLYVKYGRR